MTSAERDEFLFKHLPYRMNCLLSHDLLDFRMKHKNFGELKREYKLLTEKIGIPDKTHPYQDSPITDSVYEISLIVGRSFLNFFHLGIKNKIPDKLFNYPRRNDDVTLETLFPVKYSFSSGNFLLKDKIVTRNEKALYKLLFLANKSVGHMTEEITKGTKSEQALMPQARKCIYELYMKYVVSNIPGFNKELIWWYRDVEKK